MPLGYKPAMTYMVSVFEKPHWRAELTTKDKEKALALAKEIGDKARIEEIRPKPRKHQSPGRHFDCTILTKAHRAASIRQS